MMMNLKNRGDAYLLMTHCTMLLFVGASKNITTTQDKTDVVFSIKDKKCKYLHAIQDHMPCDEQTLHMKTNIVMFLVQSCLLDAAHEVV